ncbi:POU domain, class 3, transcription factor 2-like [Frankliniella occidentalis]|uniref:POU domain, class 3, transcription factor 2-like n=1 Tax=Frankliniella occidentalis TaxID=133901 RepID=A0A9C6XS05_FRAOC|nr:POU domain, class 3, transcription factor 2-like [Frankliniella occidentalis]
MPSSGAPQGAWELNTMERRYSVPPGSHHRSSTGMAPHMGYHEPPSSGPPLGPPPPAGPPPPPRPHHHQRSHSGLAIPSNSEDLHAWSIYRQNLNSDFTDSALGSSEKSPLPYGNFQLRDSTVHSILSHPRYGPK